LTIFSEPARLANQVTGSMARTAAGLPSGRRTTDFISLGVIAKTFPIAKIHEVLAQSGKASVRQRELPAHVMVYYVIALALS
jgi:Insertion element 4 transposase N-terminal